MTTTASTEKAAPTFIPADAVLKGTCSRQALLEAVTACQKIASRSQILPWMASVRLRASDELEVCSCSFGESWCIQRIPQATIDQPGELLVRADLLHGILAESPSETLQLDGTRTGGWLHIVGKDEEYRLPARDVDGFPEAPAIAAEPWITIKGDALMTMADRVVPWAATKPVGNKPYHGVHCRIDGSKLIMAATSGRWLGVSSCEVEVRSSAAKYPIVLLAKWMTNLTTWLGPADDVHMYVVDKRVAFVAGTLTMWATDMVGPYPPYESVMTTDLPIAPSFNREEVLKAVRRAGVMVGRESRSICMRLANNLLTLSAKAEAGEGGLFGQGTAQVRVPVRYVGNEFVISFNHEMLLEGLGSLGDPEASLGMQAADKVAIARGSGFTFALMPVHQAV